MVIEASVVSEEDAPVASIILDGGWNLRYLVEFGWQTFVLLLSICILFSFSSTLYKHNKSFKLCT